MKAEILLCSKAKQKIVANSRFPAPNGFYEKLFC